MLKRPPVTRHECISQGAVRPCPWLRCRHHNGGELFHRRWGPSFTANERADKSGLMEHSCSLDVAEENPDGLSRQDVAFILGTGVDTIRKIENGAKRLLLAHITGTEIEPDGHP